MVNYKTRSADIPAHLSQLIHDYLPPCTPEMEPGLWVTGHQVSNLGPGRVTGQSPDPAFWPEFLIESVCDVCN